MSIRFMFLRDSKGQPVGCIALDIGDFGTGTYGLSVLNPKDKFNRKLAREIAMGRWTSPVGSRVFPITCQPISMHAISITVMETIMADKTAPNRARKAAKLWLQTNSR